MKEEEEGEGGKEEGGEGEEVEEEEGEGEEEEEEEEMGRKDEEGEPGEEKWRRRKVYLFGSDGQRSHQPGPAVGASRLVVCIAAAPVGHDDLIVEQALAGGALRARGQFHTKLGSL